MKNIMLLGTLILLMQGTANSAPEKRIEAVYSVQPLTIDGKLDEAIWEKAKPVLLKENRSGNAVLDAELLTQIKTCYDDSTLYFAFLCNDPDIWTTFTRRDEHLWEEEAVEIFIDVDNVPETYVEIEVSPANILFDSYIVNPENIDIPATAQFNLAGIMTGVSLNGTLNEREDTDNSWTVEISIPFKDLVNEHITQVTAETEIKINFYRLDKNRGMNPMSYAWSPTGGRFHKPAVFGRLIFK